MTDRKVCLMKFFTAGIFHKRLLTAVSTLALASIVFSCKTTDERDLAFAAINYTQEDVLKDEVKTIDLMLKKNPVEALWRSCILLRNAPDFSGSQETFGRCEDAVVELYRSSLKEKKYLEARRIYDSLAAVSSEKISLLEYDSERLMSMFESTMPTEKNVQDGHKVSKIINGTVTIFVDKGIKIEGGLGFKDTVLGSGFFISGDGYIITNHHVISDCVNPAYNGYAKLYVTLAEDSDTRIPARVVGYDPAMDFALLKTEVDAPFVFTLGSSSELETGDSIFVIGSPLGLVNTLTGGIVSATDRDLLPLGKVFQIDAAVSPGNSGGPMIDAKGVVKAVVFAGVQNYQGLNFAIPVECLKAELPYLFDGGKRKHGWMEAYGKTRRMSGSGARNEGVEMLYVMPGGKASFAGLKEGDLITHVDGKPVLSMDELHLQLLGKSEGTIISVTVSDSDGKSRTVPVYLASRPSNPGYSFYSGDLIYSSLYPIMGMELVRSSASNKNLYSVTKVLKNSTADSSGFSEGDMVQIANVEVDKEKNNLQIVLYAKKKKQGYLDYAMSLQIPLEGSMYL